MGATAVRAGAVLLIAGVLAGCSSAVDGRGSAGSSGSGASASSHASPSGSTSSTPDFPSGSVSAPPSSSPTVASSTPTYQVVTVTGTSSGKPITVRVYAQDRIADCAAHAYGATMLRFLHANPCRGAKRVLGTTVVGGRTAVLSVVSTSFPGTAGDEYGVAAKFTKLEQSDGTGSINDLLREGHAIPGVADRIPAHEAFQVLGQDQSVAVFDAWWTTGTTADTDPTLKNLELELFLTPLSTG